MASEHEISPCGLDVLGSNARYGSIGENLGRNHRRVDDIAAFGSAETEPPAACCWDGTRSVSSPTPKWKENKRNNAEPVKLRYVI